MSFNNIITGDMVRDPEFMKRMQDAIAELEGMQDVPLPGMEHIEEVPAKISDEVEKSFELYRVVDSKGNEYTAHSGKVYYKRLNSASACCNRQNARGWDVYHVQRAKHVEWEDV